MRATRGLLLVVAFVAAASIALTAANTVPASRASSTTAAATANTIKPPECASLPLGGVFTGSGSFRAPNGTAWLVLGSAGNDTIRGGNRADCIVGGAGNDAINGGPGADICIGGPGTDTFSSCATSFQ